MLPPAVPESSDAESSSSCAAPNKEGGVGGRGGGERGEERPRAWRSSCARHRQESARAPASANAACGVRAG